MSEIIIAADLNHYKNDQMNRLYDTAGICPTILVVSGGGREIKIVERGNEELKTLKVNDLFCGAGGMGLGFKQAGFETAGAWDFDKYAVQAYAHNVDPIVKEANILDMVWSDLPQADVWTYGAPCQAFSIAGKQLGMDFKCPNCGHVEQFEGEMIIDRITPCSECGIQSEPKDVRGILFFEVMRLLKHTNEHQPENLPPVIMLENVKGISKFLGVVAYEYKKRGYKLYQTLYNSKFWGLPQNRERYFVIGVHESIEKEFIFPVQQEDYIPRLSTVLEPVVDEKYYIDDEKAAKVIENVMKPNEVGRCLRVGGKGSLSKKHNYEHIAVEQKGVVIDKGEFRTTKDERATCCDANYFKGPDNHGQRTLVKESFRVRKLTPREYLRLQGFPESFEIVVSDSQTYKQAGNAVSVPVARAIAERIKMFLLSL